ncbi:MAG: hypothetical protein VKJ87_06975 [Synechococcus sp.]|nr:hypothetical protein [Synechococcus sp.]
MDSQEALIRISLRALQQGERRSIDQASLSRLLAEARQAHPELAEAVLGPLDPASHGEGGH